MLIGVDVSGSEGQPGQRRDEWMPRRSASPWGTIAEEVVSGAEASWGPVEAEGGQWAEVPSGHLGVLHLVLEVAEEDVTSLILNTG